MAHWLLVFSAYALWASPALGAIFGTRMPPISGSGFSGAPWQEVLVSAGLGTGSLAVLVAVVILIYGFAKGDSR